MRNEERGLSQLGSPLSKIVSSLQVVDSTQDTPPNSSATTGTPSRDKPALPSTGKPNGGRGVATRPSGPPSVWQADRGLEASFPEPLRTLLRSKARYDSEFDALLGYDELSPAKTPAGEAMLDRARNALDAALAPAEPAAVLKMLARLKISTSSRNRDGDDAKLERRVFADELRRYPLDVVDEACRRWARREQWWPSIAEIVGECDRLVNWRRVTREALG
jgi:hypothetical protein